MMKACISLERQPFMRPVKSQTSRKVVYSQGQAFSMPFSLPLDSALHHVLSHPCPFSFITIISTLLFLTVTPISYKKAPYHHDN